MPDQRGQGFTKEAAKSILDFAREQDIHPVMAVTRDTNLVSQRILVDLGSGCGRSVRWLTDGSWCSSRPRSPPHDPVRDGDRAPSLARHGPRLGRGGGGGLRRAGAEAGDRRAHRPARHGHRAGHRHCPPRPRGAALRAGPHLRGEELLRWAIGLLGLRIAFGDILGLGIGTLVVVVASMAATIAAGSGSPAASASLTGMARWRGASTAVCGASAALATTTVLPNYPQKAADTAFTVVAANAVSTLVMLAYPPLACCSASTPPRPASSSAPPSTTWPRSSARATRSRTGRQHRRLVVKLFRVFLLLPVVLAIGWWFLRQGAETHEAEGPVPVFALVFRPWWW